MVEKEPTNEYELVLGASEEALSVSEVRTPFIRQPEEVGMIEELKRIYLDIAGARQEELYNFLRENGPDAIKQWFERNSDTVPDFSMLEFPSYVIPGLYLESPLFRLSVFPGTDLTGGEFVGGDFRGIIAPRSKWIGSILTGTDFRAAVMPKSTLTHIKAKGSDWSAAILNGSDVAGTSFMGATMIGTHLVDVKNMDKAEWVGAILTGARLSPGVEIPRGAIR